MYDLYVKLHCEGPSLNLTIREAWAVQNYTNEIIQIHMYLQPAHEILKYLQIVVRLLYVGESLLIDTWIIL